MAPVALALVHVYRRQRGMTLGEAVLRALVFLLVGAASAALIYSCQA